MPQDLRPFDPARSTPEQEQLLLQLAWHPLGDPIQVTGFGAFSMATQLGYRKVTYHTAELSSGHLYWVTDEHARAIAGALVPGLAYLGLTITTLEGDGFTILAEQVPEGISIAEVLVKHVSGDEVTVVEAVGLARLLHRLSTRTFSLWAGEFEPGALDAFARELMRLDDPHLQVLDVCDVTRPEPGDQIPVPLLDALLERNLRG